MRRMLVLAVLAAGACVAMGCAQLGPIYYKPSQEFSFHPPAGWRHFQPAEQELAIFESHHIKGLGHRPRLTVVVEKTDIEAPEEYLENTIESLRKLRGFEEMDREPVGNYDGWRLSYKYVVRGTDPQTGEQADIPLAAVMQFTLRRGKVYVFTFVVHQSLWSSYRGVFYDSLNSLEIGPEAVPIGYKEQPEAQKSAAP
jgi:hypothetical protein